MNEALFFASLIAVFAAVVAMNRIFGKAGLFAWVAFAPILANILTAKQITLFGLDVTMGTILFSSIFLATDIINENYGRKEATKAVWISFVSVCGYIVVANIALLFVPNEFDFANESMKQLLGTSLRISIVSAVMFLLANLADVAIYNYIKKKNKALWLRNNVSTMISNGIENFAFITLAFVGTMPFENLMIIAAGTTAVEVITSICDTPFLYLATNKWEEIKQKIDEKRAERKAARKTDGEQNDVV